MKFRLTDQQKTKVTRSIVVFLCVVVAGQEIGLAAEWVALVDYLGVELFVFCFTAPLWFYWCRVISLDPYFFISTWKQLKQLPSIDSHAVPGLLPILVFGLIGAISAST